jgi:hypothetical protein
MAVYINSLIVVYGQIDYMRLYSYDNLIDRQVYASLLCWVFSNAKHTMLYCANGAFFRPVLTIGKPLK